jgi:hypothetical protein
VRADLVGGDHEGLVLDRPRADQDLPVGAAGDLGEGRRHEQHARALDRQGAVELGEAQVVADGQSEADAAGGVRLHDLVAALLRLRLAVDLAAHLHVEHVDLPVDGLELAVGTDVHGRVRELVAVVAPLHDRPGHEVDAELAGQLARPLDRGAVESFRAGQVGVVGAEHVELLRQHHERGAVGRGGTREPIGLREVAGLVLPRVELHSGGAQRVLPRN